MKIQPVLLVALFFLLGSCGGQEPTKDEFDRMIEQEVENRLDHWAEIKRRNCEKALLDEATAIVDSIILEQARQAAAQKEKPPKPAKPLHPEPVELPDSLPLKPIFETEDSSRQLSLGRVRLHSLENDEFGDPMQKDFKLISSPYDFGWKYTTLLIMEKSRHAIN